MKKIKKEDIVGVSFFIIALVVFAFWYTSREKRNFKSKGVLTHGVFISYRYYSPARLSMTYSYLVNGTNYTRSTTLIEFPQGTERYFLHKTFPVIYIIDKPEESRILCSESDFKSLDITFPDSLSWTRKLVSD